MFAAAAIVRRGVTDRDSSDEQRTEKKKKGERVKWSNEERRAVERQLGDRVRLGIVPRKEECEKCKAAEQALANRSWKNIKFYVHTAILRNKRFSKLL